LFGYALAIACLVYVLYDIHPAKALRELTNVSWRWVLIGMGFDVLSYAVQGLRWKLLLKPFGRVRLFRSVRAVYAGLFANMVFPLRPGELMRSYLLSDSEKISFGKVLGAVGVERLIDLVVATAALGIVSLYVPLQMSKRLRRAAVVLGVVALALVFLALAAILYLEYRMGSDPSPEVGPKRLTGRLMPALIGLHAMWTAPSFYPAVLISLGVPFLQILGLWCMMRAYGLGLPFLAGVVVLLVINLGVSLPNAPANVGTYPFFCVLGLSVFGADFGVDKDLAARFSIFAFVMLTLPFLILGFIAMLRSGMSIHAMRERIRQLPGNGRKTG
jgi:glycosyltransferase 2 family protein